MAGEIATLVTDATPYVTAALGAYGGAVLTKVQDDAADATVGIGRRLLQRVFGSRATDEPLFSTRLILWSVLQGLLAFALGAAIYVITYRRGMPEYEARALAFFSLVTAVVALIFVNRSFSASIWSALRRPNRSRRLPVI